MQVLILTIGLALAIAGGLTAFLAPHSGVGFVLLYVGAMLVALSLFSRLAHKGVRR